MTEETSPLLHHLDGARSEEGHLNTIAVKDTLIVEFDQKDDPDDPQQWPKAYKWAIVFLLALMAFTVYA